MQSSIRVSSATSFKASINVLKVDKEITQFTIGNIYSQIAKINIPNSNDIYLSSLIQESFGKNAVLTNCPAIPILQENARKICTFITEKTGIKIDPPKSPLLSRDNCCANFAMHVALEDAKPSFGTYKLDIKLGDIIDGTCT